MRSAAVLVLLALLGACASDPTLHVIVKHDASYAALIDHTVVSVYESDGLTCAQIELSDVTGDVLAGALVSEAADGQPLSGLSRTNTKIIVARGFAIDGSLVTVGCASKDEIVGDDSVTIATVAAVTITVASANDGSRDGLLITTTDVNNDPVDGRQIYWRIYGAAGTSADPSLYSNLSDGVWEPKHPACTKGGDARVYPIPPRLPGGFGERLRVSWAAEPLPLATSFTPLDPSKLNIATNLDSSIVAPCAVSRHGTAVAIVCMQNVSNAGLYAYTVGAPGTLALTSTQALPNLVPPDGWIGVVAVDGSGGDRDVYAISQRGAWFALANAPAPVPSSTWCTGLIGQFKCTPAFAVSQLQVVPACGAQPGYLLARTSEGANLRMMPLRGGAPSELVTKDGEINNAGCVTELQSDGSAPKLRQVVVINTTTLGASSTPTRTSQAVFECSASSSPCTVVLPINQSTVGFYPGDEQQLVGSTFDATGATLDHWVMIPSGAKDRLVSRSRQVSGAPPRQLITAQLDGDHQPDLLWNFSTRTDIEIQLAYAREAEGAPLSALTSVASLGGASQPTAMFAADFNGDGYDELVLVIDTTLPATSVTTLVVVPTGIPFKDQFADKADDGCP